MARVIFLQRIWHEYGGPQIISALLKKYGHQVDLFIAKDSSSLLDKIQPNDIVAFSTMTGEHHWALKVASEIKDKIDVLSVFGGPHPTYFPEVINHPAVDIACCGEGEFAMLDLANARDKSIDFTNIPNLLIKRGNKIKRNEVRPLVSDLDTLPFPDRGIYYKYRILKESPLKTFIASRGCPFSCSFCFNEKLRSIYAHKGRYVRFRSPRSLINEIKETESQYGLRSIYFVDDLFVLDPKWLKEFTAIYKKEIKQTFVCSANINTLNEEVIRLLKDSGCYAVSFGIETGNEKLRYELLNKRITNDRIEKIGRILKKYKLKSMAFNIMGLPQETAEDVWETIRLNIKIGVEYPRCSILTPYPGTRIAERLKEKIKIEDIYSTDQQLQIQFEVPNPKELYNLHYFFQTAVIFPRSLWLIKGLVRFRPNILFKLWWAIVYFYVFVRSESRSPLQTLTTAFKTFGFAPKKRVQHGFC